MEFATVFTLAALFLTTVSVEGHTKTALCGGTSVYEIDTLLLIFLFFNNIVT